MDIGTGGGNRKRVNVEKQEIGKDIENTQGKWEMSRAIVGKVDNGTVGTEMNRGGIIFLGKPCVKMHDTLILLIGIF